LGRKVHPIGFRLGFIQDWQAKWYAERPHYAEALHEDIKIRQAIRSAYADAAVSRIDIERQAKEVTVAIHTARPGIVIGRGGQRVEELNSHLEKMFGKKVRLNIQEIRQPELDAFLVARTVAEQIERRIAYRRAMKQALFRTMQAGAKGVKVHCSGRLGDAEIARRQTMSQGRVPLATMRADIDYAITEAHTQMGRIGIKVWIYKGEILPEAKIPEMAAPAEAAVSKAAETVPVTPSPVAEKLAELVKAEGAKEAQLIKEALMPAAEETPAKPAPRRAKTTATAEPEEKPEQAVKEEKAEAKKKPARPRAKKAEAVPAVAEEKPAQPEAKASEAKPEAVEEKPAEPKAKKKAKAEAEASLAEEKPAKPARKSKKSTESKEDK
jgi:small subunit ribosomal protein S3